MMKFDNFSNQLTALCRVDWPRHLRWFTNFLIICEKCWFLYLGALLNSTSIVEVSVSVQGRYVFFFTKARKVNKVTQKWSISNMICFHAHLFYTKGKLCTHSLTENFQSSRGWINIYHLTLFVIYIHMICSNDFPVFNWVFCLYFEELENIKYATRITLGFFIFVNEKNLREGKSLLFEQFRDEKFTQKYLNFQVQDKQTKVWSFRSLKKL